MTGSLYDVIVLGAGPSGTTVANLLADGGASVLVLDKDVFPRFRVGESLLPANMPILERLGVDLEGSAPHVKKLGADFYDEPGGEHARYVFADSMEGSCGYAYQVERESFDLRLLKQAESRGAKVIQGQKVTKVDLAADGVVAHTDGQEYRGRYLIDATGQDALLARQNRTRHRIDEFGLGSIYGHYGDLLPESVAELEETGNVKIFFIDEGWLWAIPLGGGRLSVGLVTRLKGIRSDWLQSNVDQSPELTRLLAGARLLDEPRTIGSFSFHNSRPRGSRWLCVGDSACFLDPVFSSGVSLSMIGAADAADRLLPALREGREADAELMAGYVGRMHDAYNIFGTLILALYQRRLLPKLFFARDQVPALRSGLTSILAGHVWQENNPFQELLWASTRRRFELREDNPL